MNRPGPTCDGIVLDERGNSHPCAKRPHAVGVHVAVSGAAVVWPVGPREVGLHREPVGGWIDETQPFVARKSKPSLAQVQEARFKGFTGDACGHCGGLTLVPNGSCMKCTSCGTTTGCS